MAIAYDLSNCITLGGQGVDVDCPYMSPPPGEYLCNMSFAGITIPNFPSVSFDPLEPLTNTLQTLMGMIAPLVPFFDLLELVMKITECIQAIPKSILSLNPKSLIDCIIDMLKLVAKVAGHIPPLSLPATIAGILCICTSLVSAIVQFLKHLACRIDDLKIAFELNLDLFDVEFSSIISCEEANIIESMGAIGQILNLVLLPIDVINQLLGLAQLPEIPVPDIGSMGSSGSASPDASFLAPIIDALDAVAQGLHFALQVTPSGASMIVS